MYIDVVTKEIDDARKTIKNLQHSIRAFVTNKDFPLEERFRVWSEYADKEHIDMPDNRHGIINDYVDEQVGDAIYAKYETIEWDRLLYHIVNMDKLATKEEVMELLIETNLGSVHIDW